MEQAEAKYSVKQLAGLAGVSIRTLHHYDEIELLKPASRAESGYRYYGKNELYRLQQILFYRELDYPLAEIKRILNDPEFDLIRSLNYHKSALMEKRERMKTLLQTIDKTIESLKKEEGMITDDEMYAGFPKDEVPGIKAEVAERWGQEKLDQVEGHIKSMGKKQWAGVREEGEHISRTLANLMHKAVDSKEVQETVRAHHAYMNQFYPIGEPAYRGLGNMYVQDERFKAYYDAFKPGLATYLNNAIQVFCDNGMEVK